VSSSKKLADAHSGVTRLMGLHGVFAHARLRARSRRQGERQAHAKFLPPCETRELPGGMTSAGQLTLHFL
jgi:hypothetical protein